MLSAPRAKHSTWTKSVNGSAKWTTLRCCDGGVLVCSCVRRSEYLQTPEQLDTYKQFSMCINCLLCYAACPVYGLDPLFSGPAAIALAQRYNMDSRDEGSHERLDILSQHDGIWACTFVGDCTRV